MLALQGREGILPLVVAALLHSLVVGDGPEERDMQVISVEVFDLHMAEKPAWHPVIVRVSTDEGVSGLGEVGLENGASHAHPARVRPVF